MVFLASGMSRSWAMPEDEPLSVRRLDSSRCIPTTASAPCGSYQRHVETGRPYDEEYRIVDQRRAVHWFHDRATLLRDAAGARTRARTA